MKTPKSTSLLLPAAGPGRTRRALLLAACASLAVAASPRAAGGDAAGRVLRVVGTHFQRIYEPTPDGGAGGMGAELVRMIALQLGYTLRFQIYPWARAQQMLKQGQADILIGPYKSAERMLTMAFSSRAFFQDQLAFYARADSIIDWGGDYHALAGKRIVALNGWAYGAAFDQARPHLLLSVSNTVENGLNMLLHRRVDLFATDCRDTDPVVASLGMQGKVAVLAPLITTEMAYLAFPKQAAFDELRTQFDHVLHQMAARGVLQELGRRYGISVP